MLGFSDIADDDMLTASEIARRCGFSRASSLRRALARQNVNMPPSIFRGRYAGHLVRAWFTEISQLLVKETTSAPAHPPLRASADVIQLQAQRERARAKLKAL